MALQLRKVVAALCFTACQGALEDVTGLVQRSAAAGAHSAAGVPWILEDEEPEGLGSAQKTGDVASQEPSLLGNFLNHTKATLAEQGKRRRNFWAGEARKKYRLELKLKDRKAAMRSAFHEQKLQLKEKRAAMKAQVIEAAAERIEGIKKPEQNATDATNASSAGNTSGAEAFLEQQAAEKPATLKASHSAAAVGKPKQLQKSAHVLKKAAHATAAVARPVRTSAAPAKRAATLAKPAAPVKHVAASAKHAAAPAKHVVASAKRAAVPAKRAAAPAKHAAAHAKPAAPVKHVAATPAKKTLPTKVAAKPTHQ